MTAGPIVVDARGFLWAVDPNTAQITEWNAPQLEVAYSDPGCTGQIYARIAPRVPFQVPGDTRYHVRPDNRPLQNFIIKSRLANGACEDLGYQGDNMFVVDDTTLPNPALDPPALSFVPPFHVELE
jgi:hypothetical protein